MIFGCSSAGSYLFVSHTGFGGVSYAMAITCVRLGAETNFIPKDLQPLVRTNPSYTAEEDLPSQAPGEEVLRMGDYRDILSLTRVLVYGPKSKADVDSVIERYVICYIFHGGVYLWMLVLSACLSIYKTLN